MKIIIKGEAKEIADLVKELQGTAKKIFQKLKNVKQVIGKYTKRNTKTNKKYLKNTFILLLSFFTGLCISFLLKLV